MAVLSSPSIDISVNAGIQIKFLPVGATNPLAIATALIAWFNAPAPIACISALFDSLTSPAIAPATELGLDFDREDLGIPDVRDFMVSFFKLRLAHDYFLSNIILINEMNTDSNKALSTAMLFHTLNTSAFLSVAKEYGCTIEQLDLENVVNSARIAVNSFSDDSEVVKSEDYLNATIEVEGIISAANNIADDLILSILLPFHLSDLKNGFLLRTYTGDKIYKNSEK